MWYLAAWLLFCVAGASDLPAGFEESLARAARGETFNFVWPSTSEYTVDVDATPRRRRSSSSPRRRRSPSSPRRRRQHLPKASGKPAPNMKGGDNTDVPEWHKMVHEHAGDSQILGDIAAGADIGMLLGPEGAAIGAAIGGIIGFVPQIAAIFHTSHSHSDTIVGELQGKGFSHIKVDQYGPVTYNGLPYHSGGKKPVQMVMDQLIKSHLSDFGDSKTQSDIQTYAMVLVNGWQDGSNTFVHQNIVYNAKHGGGTHAIHMLTNANLTSQKAHIMFWKTKASIKLADDFIIHRVMDQSSNIFSSKTNCKDTLVPTALADTLNLCGASKLKCGYPNIKPKLDVNSTSVVESTRLVVV